jgi:hypothetical protein
VSGHELCGAHVNLVDVRALLPVDLYWNESFVEQAGDPGILEGFVLHHVAPVAARISNREEDGFVLASGQFKNLRRPRPPVHRIARVLAKVGAGGKDEAVELRAAVGGEAGDFVGGGKGFSLHEDRVRARLREPPHVQSERGWG